MAMDFFEHQDQARRNTLWLVLLLVLAVTSLILITTGFVTFFIYYFQYGSGAHLKAFEQNTDIFTIASQILTWELLGTISLAIVAIVGLASGYKWLQLRGGGQAIAESMGGHLLNTCTRDADERKVLNVVEEMAIASGTPVPPVYLMEEDSINAFAAGYQPQDAVIGVTRGCIQLLSRDELQGVIAHEFSHILHGDMRLNIRLIGLLHGILVIGLIGQLLLRGSFHRSAYSMASRRRDNNQGGIMAVGIGLMVIGYAGTFFGNVIKAAVSRQREFLADASAVQFTRDSSGISGALKKIGGYSAGSQLQHPNAAEFSHLYFGQGIKAGFSSLMATHPPLATRIQRIEPNWQGQFIPVETPAQAASAGAELTSGFAASANTGAPAAKQTMAAQSGQANLKQAIAHVGQPSPQHVEHAQSLLGSLPEALKQAAHEPFAARALIYGLLLSDTDNIRSQQLNELKQGAHPVVFKHFMSMLELLLQLDDRHRLPLVELAIPALKSLSAPQYQVFKRNIVKLIRADGKVCLKEWALYRILIHNLERPSHRPATKSVRQLGSACQLLLSLLAHNSQDPEGAFQAGMHQLSSQGRLLPQDKVPLPTVDAALKQLNQLKPLQKPLLLKALSQCIGYDHQVTVTEAELFRAIADSLDCPVPPIL